MVAEEPQQIYWDSCAWIGFINAEPDKLVPLRTIWEQAKHGRFRIWVSAYAYLELIKGTSPHGDPYPEEQSDQSVDDLLGQTFVNVAQVDMQIGKLARALKRKHHAHGLKKRSDAIHLATAVFWNLDELGISQI